MSNVIAIAAPRGEVRPRRAFSRWEEIKPQRIELHPATDQWMMGDMYGTATGTRIVEGRRQYRVSMDRSRRTLKVWDDHIGRWL